MRMFVLPKRSSKNQINAYTKYRHIKRCVPYDRMRRFSCAFSHTLQRDKQKAHTHNHDIYMETYKYAHTCIHRERAKHMLFQCSPVLLGFLLFVFLYFGSLIIRHINWKCDSFFETNINGTESVVCDLNYRLLHRLSIYSYGILSIARYARSTYMFVTTSSTSIETHITELSQFVWANGIKDVLFKYLIFYALNFFSFVLQFKIYFYCSVRFHSIGILSTCDTFLHLCKFIAAHFIHGSEVVILLDIYLNGFFFVMYTVYMLSQLFRFQIAINKNSPKSKKSQLFPHVCNLIEWLTFEFLNK